MQCVPGKTKKKNIPIAALNEAKLNNLPDMQNLKKSIQNNTKTLNCSKITVEALKL